MTEWIGRLDRKMGRQKRNIILFLDNASSHPDIALENIKLVFFPPNTTSACQALDQGVVKNFKVHYCQCVVRHLLANMEMAKSVSQLSVSINLLDAVLWISSSIKEIIPQTVRNCFLKAGFSCNETSNPTNTYTTENKIKQFLMEFAAVDESGHKDFKYVHQLVKLAHREQILGIMLREDIRDDERIYKQCMKDEGGHISRKRICGSVTEILDTMRSKVPQFLKHASNN
ncbi:hypothetical protein ANN_17783 [Periplaneta americana]|uniref:DDE-1 domain-containing protein n=1 Tax=Periplaneta americana TaxID=6978 RepID=A0ABQ8STW5_PERAM|nr:hypothetical protein ANN_17783 [Periplaneta americana]